MELKNLAQKFAGLYHKNDPVRPGRIPANFRLYLDNILGNSEMHKAQTGLNNLYRCYWESISVLRKANPGLSSPLLIQIPEKYFDQKRKLMIVGQQTKGWEDGNWEEVLSNYKKFNLGENYYSSPFWNMTRKIEKSLGIQSYQIIWTNLNKCDFDMGKPPIELEEKIFSSFPILPDEVKILNPDVLIFFTGPYFDTHIYRIFNGYIRRKVNEFSEDELCRIEHNSLPYHSYRTYHPKYLRVKGLESKIIEAFQQLIA